MSWLRALEIALDVTNVAINVSNASKLNELQRMGASAELRMRLANELRKQVFNFRQAADATLLGESTSLFRTAVAMRLIARRLHDSQITPDDFDDFVDKEYVYNVIKHIREHTQRLYYACSAVEQQDMPEVERAILRLPDYKYYLAKYQSYEDYKRTKIIIDTYGDRNATGTGFGLGYLKVGAALSLGLFAAMSQSIGIWVVMIGIWIGIYVGLNRWQNAAEYKEAKNIYDASKLQMNTERMASLEREFRDPSQVYDLVHDAEQVIRSAFGNDIPKLT